MRKRYKIGLALSGGGVRGAVHLGILKVLLENDIVPDIVSGTSAGSIVGALYAAGVDLDSFLEEFRKKDIYDMLDPTACYFRGLLLLYYYWPRRPMINWIFPDGLFKGDKIEKAFDNILGKKYFNDIDLPLSVVSVDINTGQTVVFCPREVVPRTKMGNTVFVTDQRVSTAVRASISLPGVFVPKRVKKHKLVDGGIKNNIPVDILYHQGVNRIIAVDLGVTKNRPKADSLVEILMASLDIMGDELSYYIRKEYPAYYVFPDLQGVGYRDFIRIPEFVKFGEEVAKRELPNIKKFLN